MNKNQASFDILQRIRQEGKVSIKAQVNGDVRLPVILREIQEEILPIYPALVHTTDIESILEPMLAHLESPLIKVALYQSAMVSVALQESIGWKGNAIHVVQCHLINKKSIVIRPVSELILDLLVVVILRREVDNGIWPSEMSDLFEMHQFGLILLLEDNGEVTPAYPESWQMIRYSKREIDGNVEHYLRRLNYYMGRPAAIDLFSQAKEEMLRGRCRALMNALVNNLTEQKQGLSWKLRWMDFEKANRFKQGAILDNREFSNQIKEVMDNYQIAFKHRLEGFMINESRLWQELNFHIDQFTEDCFLVQKSKHRREYQLKDSYQEVINAILSRHSQKYEEFEKSEIEDLSNTMEVILVGYLQSCEMEHEGLQHITEMSDYRGKRIHCSIHIDPDFLAYIDVKPTIKDYSKAVWSAVRSPMTLLFGVYMYATLFFGFDISQRQNLFNSIPDWLVILVLCLLGTYGVINTWQLASQKKKQKEGELLEKAKKEYKNQVRRSCSDFKKYWDNAINYLYIKKLKRDIEMEIQSIQQAVKKAEEDRSLQRKKLDSLVESATTRYKSIAKILRKIESELLPKLKC